MSTPTSAPATPPSATYSLAALKQQNKITQLLYGDSGAGKTVYATSFPTPIYLADFDGKASSAARFYGKDAARLGAITVGDFRQQGGETEERPFLRFYTELVRLEQLAMKGEFPYKTFIMDSLTLFYDTMMADSVTRNKAMQGKRVVVSGRQVPLQSDYLVQQLNFEQVLKRILTLPCHVLCTAHISVDKDEATGEMVRQPSITGKRLSPWLPIVFEEVWRLYVEQKDNKVYRLAQTIPDAKYTKIRSQVPGLPGTLDISQGAKALEAYLGAPL